MIDSLTIAYTFHWGFGDDALLSLPFSMLATALAASIERPYVKRAGLERSSYWLSMRANILSWLIGTLIAQLDVFLLLVYFLAIPFSILIEGGYLWLVARKTAKPKFRWKPIVFGNLLSAVLLFATVLIGVNWGDHLRRTGSTFVWDLSRSKEAIYFGVLCFCSVWFLVCFCFGYNQREKDLGAGRGIPS